MPKLSKWKVSIESGPVAADIHYIIVEAVSANKAREMAMTWANTNNIHHPMIGQLAEIDASSVIPILDDDYTDIIEWTVEEEEEFLRLFGDLDKGSSE